MKENDGHHLCGLEPIWAAKKVYTFIHSTNIYLAIFSVPGTILDTIGNKINTCPCGVYSLVSIKVKSSILPQN